METPILATLYRFSNEEKKPKILENVGQIAIEKGCEIPYFDEREDARNFKLDECLALLVLMLEEKSYEFLEIYINIYEKDITLATLVNDQSSMILVKSDKQKRQLKRLTCELVRYLCDIYHSEGEILEESKKYYEEEKPKLLKRFNSIRKISLG
jgi:hypothetical protein